jgi:hypothetical protein
MRAEAAEGEAVPRNPIRGTFAGCCAWAGEPKAKSIAKNKKMNDVLFHEFSSGFCFYFFAAHCSLLTVI